MIQLDQLSIRRGGRILFQKASMQLHPGWKIGLTGVNGAGKSTLFSALLGGMESDSGSLTRPNIWTVAHMAQEIKALDMKAIDFVLSGDEEYWLIQDKLNHSEDLSNDELAHLYSRFEEIHGYTAASKASQLMAGLGFFEHQSELLVSSFSGGWRMRLNLARTLMSRSDLLLLDEPTNHLDLDAILWLEDWLKAYEGTLILISHDRDFLDAITDHILHIENQVLTLYTGNYSTFETTRAERLAQQQQAFEKQQEAKAHLQKFIDRFKAKATKARQAQSRIKQLERMQELAPAHVDNPFTFSFREPSKMSSPLLTLEHADIGYGDKLIVTNVNLQITPSSRIGLLGMNGAGKSTLIKSLVGDLPLIQGLRKDSELLNIGYFAQHQMDALDGNASPMLQLSRIADPKISEAALRSFLGSFGFSGERMDTPSESFSGGERARLALALIVWLRPNVLILDEPTNHLDLDMRHALTMALQDFEGAVVLVSHERQLIASVCDELILVHAGQSKEFDGDLQDYATWLRQARIDMIKNGQQPSAPVQSQVVEKPSISKLDKEAQRKEAARQRELSRPIRKNIEKIESQIGKIQPRLAEIETLLADSALYEANRKDDLLKLMNEQTELKVKLEQAEEKMLELMMELETLESSFD
ncbi:MULTISPECIES: ATP-binding cassette domain-containing protein [Acinetobacter]|jgi:ATP-binding cassette subfamily F protein 3|uniref:ATP-binding cassette domain-containing protein n=1 Tax=Acinetobacter TaxID=469 RepID=UPI0004D57EE7|nr:MULTISPECIES: ATP-binding cassette domain-containing protein [Acinetobacter]KEC84845.1 ABC transporter ATP-binding protein [Acinetobacter sp. ETR1]MDI1222170.1 ATP-binding cassette domain-containing protein [Acinetobacter sp.]MDO6646084.1 ATP-binding cassette domain-containing protein [Acinetobacter guillouiae]UOH18629.1 ATP-binding cassette domain-containing protein [Acinetobacter sp. NyZ410]WEE39607.1 ATP-binding cassette domain-containing protein [Acinetobacter sp. TAC-1]